MKGQIEAKDDLLLGQKTLIYSLGMFLRFLGERSETWEDESFKEAMAAFREAGGHFAHMKFEQGMSALLRAIDAGTEAQVTPSSAEDPLSATVPPVAAETPAPEPAPSMRRRMIRPGPRR